jgi:hypothetical protein
MQQNVHISLKSQLEIINVLKNPVTKCPHFAEQAAQMGPKIMRQNNHILLKSWLDITNVFLKIL